MLHVKLFKDKVNLLQVIAYKKIYYKVNIF